MRLLKRTTDFLLDPRFPWHAWRHLPLQPAYKHPQSQSIFVAFTADVEQDHGSMGRGSTEQLKAFLQSDFSALPVLTWFVQADTIPLFAKAYQHASKRHELGLHAYHHEGLWGDPVWFLSEPSLSYRQKQQHLKKSLDLFALYHLPKPMVFRAPNLVINSETLSLLAEFGFEVDSSTDVFRRWSGPCKQENLLQLPVSSLPCPKLSFRLGLPVFNYQVFNMVNLEQMTQAQLKQAVRFITNSLPIPYLVVMGHSWDFNFRAVQAFMLMLSQYWSVKYVTMSGLKDTLTP